MTSTASVPIEYRLIGPAEGGGVGDLLVDLEQRQGRIRLQTLISEWLRMENLVVLTGSGTSVSAGGKTMANLEKDVLATIESLPDLPPSIAPIIESRKNAVAFADVLGAPIGFEAWLSFIANALVVTESSGAPFSAVTWPETPAPNTADLGWFVRRLRIAIFAECALSLPDTTSATSAKGIAPQLAFLSKLVARDSNLGRTHLFTLNYDTLFEQALGCWASSILMDSRGARLLASIRPSMASTFTIRARWRKVASAASTSSCISTSCMARSTGSNMAMKCVPAILI